jgi:hypothetical protein
MSVKKSRFISKILAGVVTTILAPALASFVGQQMGDWEQTLSVLVENELPAAKADWRQPTTQGGTSALQLGGCGKLSAPLPVLTPSEEKAGEARRVPLWSR